jgi:hypothetical protein
MSSSALEKRVAVLEEELARLRDKLETAESAHLGGIESQAHLKMTVSTKKP